MNIAIKFKSGEKEIINVSETEGGTLQENIRSAMVDGNIIDIPGASNYTLLDASAIECVIFANNSSRAERGR